MDVPFYARKDWTKRERFIPMKLNNIGSNQTELEYSDGTKIFFSYSTPVAGWNNEVGYFRTTKKYSRTTSRHINKYLEGISELFIRYLHPTAIQKLGPDSEDLDK